MTTLQARVERVLTEALEAVGAVRNAAPEERAGQSIVSRVAWSSIAEPGDGIAGGLIGTFGPSRALALALEVFDAGATGRDRSVADLAAACIEADVFDRASSAEAARTLARALDRWEPRLRSLNTARVLEQAAAVGASVLVPGDGGWPGGLSDLGRHAPLVLWHRGSRALPPPERAVSIVGSRANSPYGADVAATLAVFAAQKDRVVVSGGAYGVDAVAHRAALLAHGTTVAVLAGGLDQVYPAGNTALLEQVATEGVLVAESPPGTRPTRWRFLARNRLIAAMAETTVVVEAGRRSGALNTAHHAAELGRSVFAVPGPITSTGSVGCHNLIATSRAEILIQPDDVVRSGTLEGQSVPLQSRSDPELIRVLDALPVRRSIPLTEVARNAGLGVDETMGLLALAELQGVARQDDSGWRIVR
ncbi:DNA-processing protein DprA [Curtobacterium ammoniigenes]|uniref:DNA-processing protein DprA n=1 Tax=Curtobacterium ammoniigenes TaxID=395387 RepID=UPI00083506A2|nr:DNA-processing protein DprA [Curtobacterium ammoniigenes]